MRHFGHSSLLPRSRAAPIGNFPIRLDGRPIGLQSLRGAGDRKLFSLSAKYCGSNGARWWFAGRALPDRPSAPRVKVRLFRTSPRAYGSSNLHTNSEMGYREMKRSVEGTDNRLLLRSFSMREVLSQRRGLAPEVKNVNYRGTVACISNRTRKMRSGIHSPGRFFQTRIAARRRADPNWRRPRNA